MNRVAVIGAGSVGRAVGGGLARTGVPVVFGVRNPKDPRHGDLGAVETPVAACARADMVLLAVPADAVPEAVPALGLGAGQVLVDTTNAVRMAVPGGHATMADLVASLVPDGVAVVKAFSTIGAEHLGDGLIDGQRAFMPIAGDEAGVAAVVPLAQSLGLDAVSLGGRDAYALVEAHARLWIHLAFVCGWGRQFGFVVAGR
jgi:hypothetical protein